MAEERGLTVYESRDGQQIKLSFDTVRKYLVSGKPEFVTDQEIILYMGMCKARGLNPFKKDCYLVKYTQNDPAATIVSIDYFRSRARAQPDCVGWKSGVILKTEDGKLEYRNGAFTVEGEAVLGGWFRGTPKGWTDSYEWAVNLKPYIKKTRDGATTQFWRDDNQAYMIAKVAESQGLRRLWPDEFQGLFVHEEVIDATSRQVPEERKTLPEAPRKITEKERKRFAEACAKKNLNEKAISDRLALYSYKSTHDIISDKLDELMKWAERGGIDVPQDPEHAPSFSLTPPEDDIPDYLVPSDGN